MEHEGLVIKTDWGLLIELKEDFIFDNTNFDATLDLLAERCKENSINKILINAIKAIPKASVYKMVDTAEQFSKLGGGFKIAIIPPGRVVDELSRNMETFAFNRGVLLQFFTDKASATNWLLK